MSSGVIIAVIAGLFSVTSTGLTAWFAVAVAKQAKDAERERERESQDREQAVKLAELYGDALKSEREESARLREELRRRPPPRARS